MTNTAVSVADLFCGKAGEEVTDMDEQKITWNEMIHPDMEAIEKRDAFLSDENGKKLREMIDQIHLMEEILDCNTCEYPNECENCARAIEDR